MVCLRRSVPPTLFDLRFVPQHLTTLMTAMLFSAGVPLLLPISAVAFTAAFWVDKVRPSERDFSIIFFVLHSQTVVHGLL